MEPRLSTSRKWTPLPNELIEQIRTVFKQNFKAQIGNSVIEAQGKIFPDEIIISVGFRADKSLKQSNFAVSISYKAKTDNALKLLHLAIDAAASLFEQLFASEDDREFPRTWEEVDFEGRKIFVQYNTLNSKLESEADRLLGVKGEPAIAKGDWDEDVQATPEQIKAHLGLVDDDDEGN